MLSFGKRIASVRKELKMSQTDLANKLNTSVSVISRYELYFTNYIWFHLFTTIVLFAVQFVDLYSI